MKLLILMSLLLARSAVADEANLSVNSIPLFANMVESKYQGAASKAQEAFFIQTGVTESVGMATNAATKAAVKAIDNKPFKSKDVIFVAGATYAIIVKKQVIQKFKNPIFPKVTNVVTVGKESSSLMFALPF